MVLNSKVEVNAKRLGLGPGSKLIYSDEDPTKRGTSFLSQDIDF